MKKIPANPRNTGTAKVGVVETIKAHAKSNRNIYYAITIIILLIVVGSKIVD